MPATSSPAQNDWSHWPGPTGLAWWEASLLKVPITHSQALKILVLLGAFMYEIKYYLYADKNDDILYVYKTWSYYQ